MSTWALVGSPNSGKTTLYNWLTGSKSKTVNYPGSTVEYNVGLLRSALSERIDNAEIHIVDTPGIYSLIPQSEDERVAHEVLFSSKKVEKLDGVVVVLDATQLGRHLLIAKQVKESGYPYILAITMRDLIEKSGTQVDLRALTDEFGEHVVLFDGVLGKGLDELVLALKNTELKPSNTHYEPAWTEAQHIKNIKWAESINERVIPEKKAKDRVQHFTQELDKVLMHPVFGFILFFFFMTLLFTSIYWMAQPAMDAIDTSFSWLASFVTEHIPGLAGDFLGNGLITAVGGVVVFVPQIFILFIGIGLLESTGYLARVAALVDKPLSMIGLGGRSFVPLLSGFACAIPAIMATRNITSKKEKLIAQSIIPFMTCSARLPVYALLIGFLYGDRNPFLAGFIMALLYFGALVVGAVAAHIIAIFVKDRSSSRLLMELPLYRRPRLTVILMQALTKSKSFLKKAGPIIFVLALVLWLATNFPRPAEINGQVPTASEIAQDSYAAQVGHAIEPIFRPMGVDWRVGFGLISAFAAREVFVSSLSLMYNVDAGDNEDAQTKSLLTTMKKASFEDGTLIFTPASVTGILIFFMIALQCTSTVGILRREAGSWKPALLQLGFSNLVAYCLAVSVVFVLHQFGL